MTASASTMSGANSARSATASSPLPTARSSNSLPENVSSTTLRMVRLSSARRIREGMAGTEFTPDAWLRSPRGPERRARRDAARGRRTRARDAAATTRRKIHARFVAHAVEHEEQVLGRDVARRARRVRAAAEAARRRVEDPHALAQALDDVRERGPARVVEVQREPLDRDARLDRPPDDVRHLRRNADADRVADRHLVAADREEPRGNARDGLRRDRPLVRAAERARHVAAHAHARRRGRA